MVKATPSKRASRLKSVNHSISPGRSVPMSAAGILTSGDARGFFVLDSTGQYGMAAVDLANRQTDRNPAQVKGQIMTKLLPIGPPNEGWTLLLDRIDGSIARALDETAAQECVLGATTDLP